MCTSKKLICLIMIAMMFSCKNIESEVLNLDLSSINLIEGIANPTNQMLLSDLATSVEFIQLETSDKSIFNQEKITNIISTSSGILIGVGKRVLHFDRQGKYIGDIGKFGDGPQDFYYTKGLGYNEASQEVYVPSNFGSSNELKTYRIGDGKFLDKIKVAQDGISLITNKNNGEAKEYCFLNGMHIIRRKLPLPNPSEEPWQILIKDGQNKTLACIYDPVSLNNLETIKEMSGNNINKAGSLWGSEAPILNSYNGNLSIVFEGNDTVYNWANGNKLVERFTMNSSNNLSDKEIHQVNKTSQYFNQCVIVKDFLETKDYLYFVVENKEYAYLLQFNKETGNINSIQNKGELKHSSFMNVDYRVTSAPEFTNNLSGGPAFYPFTHNEQEWIDFYSAEELIKNIENIKLQQVLQTDKKEQLIQLIETLDFEDNPVIMIVTLKK